MYTLNNVVLETTPCGRPIFDCLYFDSASSNHTLTHVCARNLPNQVSMFPLTPYILSLLINLLFQTVSMNTARMLFLGLNICFTSWTNLITEFDVEMSFLKQACSSTNIVWLLRSHFSLVNIILSKTFVRNEIRTIGQYDSIYCWFSWL